MNKNSSQPLHKTVHFRRLREVLYRLAKLEAINIDNYDLNNIKCYKTYGTYLNGKNITVTNIPNSRTCFVSDNKYEIFEIPSKTNKRNSCIGDFLIFARNISFNYCLLLKLNYSLLGVKNGQLLDKATITVYGQYSVESNSKKQIVSKIANGPKCDFGNNKLGRGFDVSDFRKVVAYKTNSAKLIAQFKNVKVNKLTVVDNSAVKIYNKRGRK